MHSDSPHVSAGKQTDRTIVLVLSAAIFIFGLVLVGAGGMLQGESTLQSVMLNTGSGFLSGGIMAMAFERLTRDSGWLVSQLISTDVMRNLEKLHERHDIVLLEEVRRLSLETRAMLREVSCAGFQDSIRREVFASGVVGAYPLWSGRVPADFMLTEPSLRVMLKDGRSFFKEREADLKDRFRRNGFRTTILILHPDSPYMGAVARMDHVKADDVYKQVKDCHYAIEAMQKIGSELLKEGVDIRKNVDFLGYPFVPTWTGFIGESLAYVSMFFTRPHRGDLNTIVIRKHDDRGEETQFYKAMSREYEEIRRHIQDSEEASLFDYSI
ncbi:hypothetical protein [Povalibacter sp.]|uniref:hypothetical protein n=1 Tax=Povalibacter sp. TaxID=1962978 RepID=UPI002F3E9483